MNNNHSELACVEVNPAGKPSATVIWLHGLGADGHDFEAIVPELRLPEDLPVRYVFPHAPKRPVTINAGMVMRAWFDILDIRLDRKVDLANFLESAASLEALIEKEHDAGMPSHRIVLAGFSQGGAVALHTGLRYKEKLAGILALSTYLPTTDTLETEKSDVNADIPIMMAHGTMDPLVRMSNAVTARQALDHLGYQVKWHEYPIQHQVCMEEINDIGKWLINILG